MRLALVFHLLGRLLLGLTLLLLLPLALALATGGPDALAFGASALATGVTGGLLVLAAPFGKGEELGHREGFAVVTLAWIFAAAFGGLPFYLFGATPTYTDAYFEAMSGFTTTGATVITRVEELPTATVLWRSFSQWVGGLGIIVLGLAILPALGVGGMQLYKAEAPGPVVDRLAPRIRETARLLWRVYVLISAAEFALLLLGGMSWLDALAHAFTTMATGGFSTRDASIGAYGSAYLDGVITVFMFLAGASFALHYQALRGNLRAYRRSPEFLLYAIVLAGATGLLVLALWLAGTYGSLPEALRHASFQVVSLATTTGYATADYEAWPPFAQGLLFLLMVLGGCAGSTAGAIKYIRVLLLAKRAYAQLFKLVHPRAVVVIRLGERQVPEEVLIGVQTFFLLYLSAFALATLAATAFGIDLYSSIGAVAATLGNVGPGFGAVGPAETYAPLPLPVKWILSTCMLLGRLEIFTVLVLLMPAIWRK